MYTELKSKSTNSYFNQKSFHGSVLLSLCQKISCLSWCGISLFTQQSDQLPSWSDMVYGNRKSLNFIPLPILLLNTAFDYSYFGVTSVRTGGGIWFVPVSDTCLICSCQCSLLSQLSVFLSFICQTVSYHGFSVHKE